MPDWTYHPFYKPVIFRFHAESGRKFTMWFLSVMGKTRPGRNLFCLLSFGIAKEQVNLFGLTFPSRYGVGPYIDLDGRACSSMQFLGCGFLTIGPISEKGVLRKRENDSFRIPFQRAIIHNENSFQPGVDKLKRYISQRSVIKIPVGGFIKDDDPVGAINSVDDFFDFFTVNEFASEALVQIRNATKKPVLLRIDINKSIDAIIEIAETAHSIGLNGIVIGQGLKYRAKEHSYIDSPECLEKTVDIIKSLKNRFKDDLPIVASSGIIIPEDAKMCIRAGADLVEISTGFIYGGPGFVARALKLDDKVDSSSQVSETPPLFAVKQIPTLLFLQASVLFCSLLTILFLFFSNYIPKYEVLFSPSALSDVNLTAILFAQFAFIFLSAYGFAKRQRGWVSWMILMIIMFIFPLSKVLAGLLFFCLLFCNLADKGWLTLHFRNVFEKEFTLWVWNPVNLGKRCIQTGYLLSIPVLLSSNTSADIRISASGISMIVFLLISRGLLPGFRLLWYSVLIISLLQVFTLWSLSNESWQNMFLGLFIFFNAAGLSWLWEPLILTSENKTDFIKV